MPKRPLLEHGIAPVGRGPETYLPAMSMRGALGGRPGPAEAMDVDNVCVRKCVMSRFVGRMWWP